MAEIPLNRTDLHEIIDTLPDSKLPIVRAYLRGFQDGATPVPLNSFSDFLDSAPYDDEELTAEELAGIQEGLEDIKAGRVYTLEEVEKELFG